VFNYCSYVGIDYLIDNLKGLVLNRSTQLEERVA